MLIHRVGILLLALALAAQSATLFVSPSGDGGDGLSWTTAFSKIADAITASSTNDEIWIRGATYEENLTIDKALSIIGGFSGIEDLEGRDLADPRANPTVIDGSFSGPVFLVEADFNLKSVCLTHGGEWPNSGGGIRARGVDVYLVLGLERVEIKDNGRTPSGPIGVGGGMLLESAACEVVDCTFHDNMSSAGGGAIFARESDLLINRCTFSGNISNLGGVLTLANLNGTCRISGSKFLSNRHTESLTSDQGDGSVFSITGDAPVEVSNCIFSDNTDSNIYLNLDPGVGISWVGCTFDIPEESWAFVQREFGQSAPVVVNSIVRGHEEALFPEDRTSPHVFPIVTYSNVEGGYEGEGNIDAEPLWADRENGDYHLQGGSPCIDSGTEVDLSADFDGNPRPIGQFDMGAFEYPFLRSDINVDGAVDAMDLLIFSQDWGLVSQP